MFGEAGSVLYRAETLYVLYDRMNNERLQCKSGESVQEMKLEAYEVCIFTFQFLEAIFLEASCMMYFRDADIDSHVKGLL